MTNDRELDGLAIFGGVPTFEHKLHVGRPNIGDRERLLQRINDMLDEKWLTNNGPYVQELERRLSDKLGVRHCIATCNATVALEITIRALGLSGEVIVPSFTFIATAHALQWQEITPVFCDIDPKTHTIDPAKLQSMITPRTSGIVGVHLWGNPCHIDELHGIAQEHGIKLMFDASHALGCTYGSRMIGQFGEAEVFSLHATKFLNSCEGGIIATNNDALAAKIRLMKNFGFAGYDNVIYIGTNGKMSEMSAAMGLTSLESMDSLMDTNLENHMHYRRLLPGIPGVEMLACNESEQRNHQYVVLEIDESAATVSRDVLMRVLQAENVVARRYFYPGCHRMEPYRSYFPHAGLLLPETERVAGRVLVMPTGTSVGIHEISGICEIIRTTVSRGQEITERLLEQLDQGPDGHPNMSYQTRGTQRE